MLNLDLQLSDTLSDIADSRVVFDAWETFSAKHDLTAEEYQVLFELNSDIYTQEKKLKDVIPFLQKNLKANQEKIAFDLALYIYSPVEKEIGEDVRAFVAGLKGDMKEYDKVANEIKEKLEAELHPDIDALLKPEEGEIEAEEAPLTDEEIDKALTVEDVAKERVNLQETFSEYLLEALFAEEPLKFLINYRLIYTLGNSEIIFKNLITTAVSENQTVLTKGTILVGEQERKGTVAHWIQDFIKTMGLQDRISAVKRAQYIGTSKNVGKLDAEDKKKVNTLLEFYRMLQGFPGSLENIPPKSWYLIPMESMEAEKLAEVKEKAARLKTDETPVPSKSETPESVTPVPVTPESVTPEPVTPEPVTPKPETHLQKTDLSGGALAKTGAKPPIRAKDAVIPMTAGTSLPK